MEQEIWKDVVNYEGIYQVSNLGNVKSIFYKRNKGNNLVLVINNWGYLRVRLWKNKKGTTLMVHRLVAESFLNHKPKLFTITIDHINCIKTDNRLSNLQLISNRLNSTKDKVNSTGHHNIYKNTNTYRVRFKIGTKLVQFGKFKTIEEAIEQRNKILLTL